jgi:hypothetical protein
MVQNVTLSLVYQLRRNQQHHHQRHQMKAQMRREIECEKKLVLALQSVSRLRRLSTVSQLLQIHQQSNLKKKKCEFFL